MNKESFELILSTLCAVLTIIVSYWIFHRQHDTEISIERLNKVFSPIFELIEPYLLVKITVDNKDQVLDIVKRIENIAAHGQPLSGGKIRHYLHKIDNSKDWNLQRNYDQLCDYISREYDSLCRTVGIPLRPLEYKLSKAQIKRWKAVIISILYVCAGLLIGIIMLIPIVLLMNTIQNEGSTEITTAVLLICLVILILLMQRKDLQ